MRCCRLSLLAGLVLSIHAICAADEPVFSGPQVGEQLGSFLATGVFDEAAGQEFDFVASHAGGPLVLVFVHELTRPSLATARAIGNYAGTRQADGLGSALVFLGEDATETEERIKRARRALPQKTVVGISSDGREGPGSYGLNRNVTLTVLVADKNQVTANFAIVQPTPVVDVPKIVAQINKLVGGEMPTLAQLGIQRHQNAKRDSRMARGGAQDLPPELQAKLRSLIRKSNSPEDVERAAAAVEDDIQDDVKTRAIVGAIAGRVQNARYFNDLIPEAQAVLREWSKKYGPEVEEEKREDAEATPIPQ